MQVQLWLHHALIPDQFLVSVPVSSDSHSYTFTSAQICALTGFSALDSFGIANSFYAYLSVRQPDALGHVFGSPASCRTVRDSDVSAFRSHGRESIRLILRRVYGLMTVCICNPSFVLHSMELVTGTLPRDLPFNSLRRTPTLPR
jgi:hypothetical protein